MIPTTVIIFFIFSEIVQVEISNKDEKKIIIRRMGEIMPSEQAQLLLLRKLWIAQFLNPANIITYCKVWNLLYGVVLSFLSR